MMSEMVSDQKIKEVFLQLESDPELYKFSVRGFSLYFILRSSIELAYRFKSTMSNNPSGFSGRMKRMVRNSIDIFRSMFHTASNKPNEVQGSPSRFLFVSTSDWTIAKGESIELVDIIKYYKSRGIVINFAQPDYNNLHAIWKQPYHDSFWNLRTNNLPPVDIKTRIQLKEMTEFIGRYLQMDLSEEIPHLLHTTAYVLQMAEQLTHIITATKSQYVFARSVYTEPWVVMACKQANAKCIEVQHGVVTPDNIYYQTANEKTPAEQIIFPDYILTLGREWTNILINYRQKYTRDNTFTLGIKGKPVASGENNEWFNVLACLQPGIFDINPILQRLLNEYGEQLRKQRIKIIVRPHPSSVEAFVEIYKPFEEFVEVENPRKTGFYQSLSSTNALVSLSSMCLYEALSIGIPVISFNYSKGITIPDDIVFVNDHHELMQVLEKARAGSFQVRKHEYLNDFDEQVLERFIGNN